MALRNIDTNFFKSPKVRGLKAPLKTLYLFIICDCNGAGIWAKDLELATLYTGNKYSESDFDDFCKKINSVDLKNGKYFFPDFIEHQYPKGLSPNNPALKNFIQELIKYNLLDAEYQIIKTLQRPFKGSLVTVTVNEDVIVTENVIVKEPNFEIFETDLQIAFNDFYEMRKKIKKPPTDNAKKMINNKLNKLAPNNETEQIEILNQSTLNNWQDIYPLKNKNGTKQNTTSERPATIGGIPTTEIESLLSKFNRANSERS
jgi:hypothetical protein